MTDADRQALAARLRVDEGTGPIVNGRFMPYPDSLGFQTIGYGRCIEKIGISHAAAEFLLAEDVAEAERTAVQFLGATAYDALTGVRQQAVCELGFALGIDKLRKFVSLRAALIAGDYAKAAAQLRSSLWCRQVKAGRCGKLSGMLETGVAG